MDSLIRPFLFIAILISVFLATIIFTQKVEGVKNNKCIDHFLLSQHLAKRLKKTEVDKHVRGWEKTSDHAPVWIELKDK